jgi:RNA polymerase sigma factor (sigma-70 family)
MRDINDSIGAQGKMRIAFCRDLVLGLLLLYPTRTVGWVERDWKNPEESSSSPSSVSVMVESSGLWWAARLKELLPEVRRVSDDAARREACGEFWMLLNTRMFHYLQSRATGQRGITREDLEDIAAEKSLALLQMAQDGRWDISSRCRAEIAAYLSKAARNALRDFHRVAGRQTEMGDDDQLDSNLFKDGRKRPVIPEEHPDVMLDCKEFVKALRQCVKALKPRSRTVWFFRVFYQLTSRQIAAHPEVRLTPNHVDVLLKRCRHQLRDCMQEQGYEPQDMPAGAFYELWRAFRFEVAHTAVGSTQ